MPVNYTVSNANLQSDGWHVNSLVTAITPYQQVGTMSKYKAAVARGAPNIARILFNGDSTNTGEGAGTGGSEFTDARKSSWPVLLAAAKGWQDASFIGDQNITVGGVTIAQYDPRIALGAGWASDAAVSTLGGRFLIAPGGSAGLLSFTPGKTITKIRLWYVQVSSGNTAMTVFNKGVQIDTLNTAGANAFLSKIYTVTKSSDNVITIGVGATGQAFIQGIECWDDTNPAPSILIAGNCGAVVNNLVGVGTPWDSLNALIAYAPDVVSLNCTVNGINGGVGANGVVADVGTLNVAANAMNADVVNIMGNPSSSTNTPLLAPGWEYMLRANAAAYNGSYSNPAGVFGTYPEANAKGLMYNANHPSATGHQLLATYHAPIFY